jgi:hypothetical protein
MALSMCSIGGRPKTAKESLKKLKIATGISQPSDFARDSRNRNRLPPASGHASVRLMEPSVAVKNIFQERYLYHGASRMSIENVDKLIKEITPASTSEGSAAAQQLTASLKSVERRWNSTHRLGALQLLAAIKQGLFTEEPRLKFDYFGMHKRSIDILRRIRTKEDHMFRRYFTDGYMPDETLISNLVIQVLTVAQGSAATSAQLGIGGGGSVVASRIIVSCGQVMEEYLRGNGDKAVKDLRKFCVNKALIEFTTNRPMVVLRKLPYWFNLEDAIGPAALASLQTGISVHDADVQLTRTQKRNKIKSDKKKEKARKKVGSSAQGLR